MGGENWSKFQLETKNLLWLIGITFTVIIAFQYLELPYGNVISSLLSSDKISQATDTNTIVKNNVTSFNESNFSDENNTIPTRTGFILEPENSANKSHEFDVSDKSTERSSNVSNTLKAEDIELSSHNITVDSSFSTNTSAGEENNASRLEHLVPPLSSTTNVSPNITTAVLSNEYNNTLSHKDNITSSIEKESLKASQKKENSVVNIVPKVNQEVHKPIPVNQEAHKPISEVTTVSEMNKLLLQSHVSYRSMVCVTFQLCYNNYSLWSHI